MKLVFSLGIKVENLILIENRKLETENYHFIIFTKSTIFIYGE